MKYKAPNLKTLGLIGGMSGESTVPYYQLINRAVQAQLGGWLADVGHKPSSWAAPKSPSCSIRKTAPCRCLTPPPCTPKAPLSGP